MKTSTNPGSARPCGVLQEVALDRAALWAAV